MGFRHNGLHDGGLKKAGDGVEYHQSESESVESPREKSGAFFIWGEDAAGGLTHPQFWW